MYTDTITVFNHYVSKTADLWFPTIIHNADVNADKATIMAKFGAESTDNATLHIKLNVQNGKKTIADKPYLLPKEWAKLPNDELSENITFASGNDFSFFVKGEWDDGITPISDADYSEGFYEYMNRQVDEVFAVTSVAEYSVIPHLEILAK